MKIFLVNYMYSKWKLTRAKLLALIDHLDHHIGRNYYKFKYNREKK